MSKLTALQVKNQKEPCRLSDGKGLYFEITTNGLKRWLYRYKLDGKQGACILGRYPELSLADARTALIGARTLTKEGINPAQARKKKKQETIRQEQDNRSNSFENIALEWLKTREGKWSLEHAKRVKTRLQKDVFPFIGDRPVDEITPPEIIKVLRRIESRGVGETAARAAQEMSAVFRYAIQTGKATYNPASDMQGVLASKKSRHMPALLNKDLAPLLRDITQSQNMNTVTKLALHFTALTACRGGEVRQAQWSEIDLEEKVWNIPAERMKMKRPHIVPLSKQALAILHRLEKLFGTEGYLFPSVRFPNKPMSNNTMGKALRDMGYKGKATPHGFRSSFSTMAYESNKFAPEVIEKALAHEEGNKVKGAYNRAEYLERRRELLAWWGSKLQTLEHGAEIIPFNRSVNEP